MSDEKIDHAAEAADMVNHAATSDDEMERRLTGQAQVHATLALVEQQRIANLIALGHKYSGSDDDREAYAALLHLRRR